MVISNEDRAALIRDKYDGDQQADVSEDEKRLAAGEPLAYVIGWIPFLGLKIHLDLHPETRPLIPRPETEYWTEELINYLKERFGAGAHAKPFTFLDLCAGSGAIGLAVLHAFPNAHVSFGELSREHAEQIIKNIHANNLDTKRVCVKQSDLFALFQGQQFDVIATNPPYIPSSRVLDASVMKYEPHDALFAGPDGLTIIERILRDAEHHLNPGGELWMECDTSNIQTASKIARSYDLSATTNADQYGRSRLLVATSE